MGIGTRGYHPAISAMRESMALRAELIEAQWERMDKLQQKKQLKKAYWWGRLAAAMSDLRALDPGWEAWFDSDAVPDTSLREMVLAVEARCQALAGSRLAVRAVARLYRGVFIWRDARGCFILDESRRMFEFKNEAEARAHVDATLAMVARANFS